MDNGLIQFIALSNVRMSQIFEPPYVHHSGWQSLFAGSGPLRNGATGVINQMASGTSGSLSLFHSLYIACWIHRPVEKGSYMISLEPWSPNRLTGIRAAYENLGKRWSSHLSETGRSAGQGFRFLRGYHELLVQIETDRRTNTPYLFLKAEGHSAASLAHIFSFVTKYFTGKGNTQNRFLNSYAESGRLPIVARAAENYSKAYEALLSNLGIVGKVVSVDLVIPSILDKLERKTSLADETAVWANWKANRAAGKAADFTSKKLAQLIKDVILPTISKANLGNGRHVTILREARGDLARLADDLLKDAENCDMLPAQRYFQEIRLSAQMVDNSLISFQSDLKDAVMKNLSSPIGAA